jgi:RNA 3'-terminal phosphate cyclase (ATP)
MKELEHEGCVDEHMRDQFVVFQALAMGKSNVYGGKRREVPLEPSLHARTAHWVAKEIINVQFDGDGGCEGVGLGAT